MKGRTYSILFRSAAVLFFLILFYRGAEDAAGKNYNDYHAYFKGGLAFSAKEPLYANQEEPSFKYSPFFALLMVPMTWLGEQASFVLWILLTIIQLFFIIHWSRKLLDRKASGDTPKSLWLYSITILSIITYITSVMDKGQTNILVLFWITWAWLWITKQKSALAGLCLAMATLVKLTPILFVPFLLIRKQFKCLLWWSAFLVGLSLIPWLIQGSEEGSLSIQEWFKWLLTAHDPGYLAAHNNQSILGAVQRLFSRQENALMVKHGIGRLLIPLWSIRMIYMSVNVTLYAVALIPTPRSDLKRKPYELFPEGADFATLLAVTTLIFPMAWKYYFVTLLLPLMLVALYLHRNRYRDRFVLCAIGIFLITVTFLPAVPNSAFRVQAYFYSTITWGTLVLILALLKIKLFPLNIWTAHQEKAPSAVL